MSVAAELATRVAEIARDREHGATELARRALDVLDWLAAAGESDRLFEAADALTRARPAMAAIGNVVRRVVQDPAAADSGAHAVEACRRVRAWLEESARLAARQAAAVVPDEADVLTCSYSSAVIEACRLAAGTRRVRVLALASQIAGLAHGERVAASLRASGVACEVVPDERLEGALGRTGLVLVGADCVLPDGALVNGSPSWRVARSARDAGVRFDAICEAFKLAVAHALEPGFDLVPPDLVTAYLTRYGPMAPGDVWNAHARP